MSLKSYKPATSTKENVLVVIVKREPLEMVSWYERIKVYERVKV